MGQTFTRTRPAEFTKRQDEDGNEVFEFAVSSETDEVRRWFGREILLHTRRAVDLSRVKENGGVAGVLLNHDPNQIVGSIVNPRVDADRVIRMGVRFDDTALGRDARTQVLSRSLRGASISYTYAGDGFEDVEPGKVKKLTNGREIEGPARIVKRWTLIEPTLTPTPADASVGLGRQRKDRAMFKWRVVSEDGAIEHKFRTKKEANEFCEECDFDGSVEKIEAKDPRDPPRRTRGDDDPNDPPAKRNGDRDRGDDDPPLDRERIAEEAVRTFNEQTRSLRELGEMAGDLEFVNDTLDGRSKPFTDEEFRDLNAQIHKRWADKRKKEHRPPNNAPPPEPGGQRGIQALDDDSFVRNVARRDWSDLNIEAMEVMRADDFRSLLRVDNGRHFQERTLDLLSRDPQSGGARLIPDQMSLRAMWQALHDVPVRQRVQDEFGGMRFITTSAFSVLTGNIAISVVREAYEGTPRIGDQLTQRMQSTQDQETIPAILNESTMINEVGEGEQYDRFGLTEEHVTIGSRKQGGILPITREVVMQDKTGQILMRMRTLATAAAKAIERHILLKVTDRHAENVYKPNGTGTALYSTTARTRGTNQTNSNALVDTTDLDAAWLKLAGMTEENGVNPIVVRPEVLLVPQALFMVASKILQSDLEPGTENEMNNWGPRGTFGPRLLTSPFLDTFTNGTSDWYLGEPAKQFIRKERFGIETTTRGVDSEASFDRDVVQQIKVAFDIEVGAIDYVWFHKSQSGA